MAKRESSLRDARAGLNRTQKVASIGAVSRALLVVAIGGSLISGLAPAVAQPVNPDDETIAQAEQNVQAGDGEVARLASSLSATEAEINRLELEMGALREAVNKDLVDLHDAQAQAEKARQDASAAKAALEESQRQIDAAQERLNEISRAAYRQNGTTKGISGLAGTEASEDALDRQTYLRTTAEKEQAAVAELDKLRTENANKESELREARILAEKREAEATEKQQQTQSAIETNSAQISELNNSRTTLVAQRDQAQQSLAEARTAAQQLNSDRAEYQEFQRAEEERKKAEAEAAAAAEQKRQAEEAAAKAAQEAAAAQAAQAAEQEANDRAAAQAKAAEAQAAAEQAQAAADAAAADDAAAKELQNQALAAATVAAAAVIAASQADHATTENPYPTGEDEAAAEIAAIQGPATARTAAPAESTESAEDTEVTEAESAPSTTATPTPAAELPVTGSTSDSSDALYTEDDYYDDSVYAGEESSLEDLEDVTSGASTIVTGDREAKIEAVIARGMSQLGVQYAWGGGNANGPTLGIRDGGVADSYGDYNKVGFDCSGLTLYAFAGVGIALPHYTGYQYQYGTQIPAAQMERGDLIFYGPGASQHVAIYLGDGQMLEAPSSGSTVMVSPVRWSGMTPNVVRLL